MEYLAKLMSSSGAHVTFVSETRTSSHIASQLNSHFNSDGNFVVPSIGLSGGLWLLWNDDVKVCIKFLIIILPS